MVECLRPVDGHGAGARYPGGARAGSLPRFGRAEGADTGGPRAAIVALYAADGGPPHLEVRWSGDALGEAPDHCPVRVMFETRA